MSLYVQEVRNESIDAYWQERGHWRTWDTPLKAIVLDGRPGGRQLFCYYPRPDELLHQKQIITRYLTNNLN